ncbi:TAP-like protein-domain-containing protein [Podospora australis]|uniref:TAP-like protein-domain-containing protein n=1 Tax=Podospora australis TaxID=1536484 RepID=A0AAN6WN45_9PEZI|nr:TAP-like protein-domain-containing protein [Podospora australis]
MGPLKCIILATITSTAIANPLLLPHNGPHANARTIEWGPCNFINNGPSPIACATFAVPLDYTEPNSHETLNLSLIRSNALIGPSKGSILFNFGGPGGEAVQSLNAGAGKFHKGTGNTMLFSCYDNQTERDLISAKYPDKIVGPLDMVIPDLFAGRQAVSNICEQRYNGSRNGTLIGTAFVARDMIEVVDALNEDGLLRYWGFSYGTVLGATVAAMFPERVNRVVLDGVANAHNYYHHFGIDLDEFVTDDAALRAVLAECVAAGPDRCSLASLNSTAAELEATLIREIATLKRSPVVVGGTVIDGQYLQGMLFNLLKNGLRTEPERMYYINALLKRENLTEVVAFTAQQNPPDESENLLGIKCGDLFRRAETVEDVVPEFMYIYNSTKILGELVAPYAVHCSRWPFAAKERYAGDFMNVKTRYPILFVANTYDPVTPVLNARNMSVGFEGSVVLEQNGFGHCSTAQSSGCTESAIAAYFTNGTLPAPGAVCPVESKLF